MASAAAVNPGLSDLLQSLSNIDSPVVSSPAAVAALEKAPPADIVQLSESALQLEGVDALFGIQTGSASTNLEDLLNGAVGASITEPGAANPIATSAGSTTGSTTGLTPGSSGGPAATPSTQSPAEQIANYQLAEAQTLFDPGTNGGTSNSLLNLFG